MITSPAKLRSSCDVLRDAADQQADLRRGSAGRAAGRTAARPAIRPGSSAAPRTPRGDAEPGQPRGRRVEHVGDPGGGDERRQHRGEQLQRQPRDHQQADQQRDALAARRAPAARPPAADAAAPRSAARLAAASVAGRRRRQRVRLIACAPSSRHRRRRRRAWSPRPARSARCIATGDDQAEAGMQQRHRHQHDLQHRVQLRDVSAGGSAPAGRALTSTSTPPTITTSRNTTRIASQSGSTCTAARVTYIDTSSALSATGSSSAPTVVAAVAARQPAVHRVRQAGRDEQEEGRGRIGRCSTSQTASGTAQSRAEGDDVRQR